MKSSEDNRDNSNDTKEEEDSNDAIDLEWDMGAPVSFLPYEEEKKRRTSEIKEEMTRGMKKETEVVSDYVHDFVPTYDLQVDKCDL